MRALITGAAGFVGHHTVEWLLDKTNWEIIGIDSFRHKGDSLRVVKHPRYEVFYHDLNAPISDRMRDKIGPVDYVINLASMSHVDTSISDPIPFWESNTRLIGNILEFSLAKNVKRFIQCSCYDDSTRAMTRRGLLSFNEITIDDEVLSLNPKTRTAEWKKINKIIIQDYSGEMIHFKSSLSDLLVTPNHRMYHDDNLGNIHVTDARTLSKKWLQFYPMAKTNKEFCERSFLMGALLGDGFACPQTKITKSKTGFSKLQRKRNSSGQYINDGTLGNNKFVISKSHRIFLRVPETKHSWNKIETCLNNLGISWTRQKNGQIFFTSKEFCEDLVNAGRGALNKTIPQYFWSKFDIKSLFDGLVATDGSRKGDKFYTSSKLMAESFSALAAANGYSPRITIKPISQKQIIIDGRTVKQNADAYCVSLRRKVGCDKKIAKTKQYSGKIWCLSVEDNKNLLVERNGIMVFSGNTDEVFGAAPDGYAHHEWDVILPSNPYAASKAAQEALCIAYWRTYGLPIAITNCMNMVGLRQDSEKFLPMLVRKIYGGETVTIHGTPNKIGSRMYLDCRNLADAWLFIISQLPVTKYQDGIDHQKPDKFNIAGLEEINNLELAKRVALVVGKELKYEFVDFHKTRSGHDRRYALDCSKILNLGWRHPIPFDNTIKEIVEFTLSNKEWLK